jgi:hypothetical protein
MIEQLIEEVKSYKPTVNSWRNNFNSKEYQAASKLNKLLFGISLNRRKNCNCVDDLLLLIYSKTINQKIETMNSNFRLKPNAMIMLHGIDAVTNDNLTDEIAINILKKYPSHSVTFEKLPTNWRELVTGKETKAKTETVTTNDVTIVEEKKQTFVKKKRK